MSKEFKKNVLSRTGWSDMEVAILEDALGLAVKSGKTLRAVFEKVADETGRKPNSVRNYYYTALRDDLKKELGSGLIRREDANFIPFTIAEIRDLLKKVLSAQAQGKSVRACTIELSQNDKSLMLRYQNKYRSLIKTHRNLVESVINEMVLEEITCFNPYTRRIEGDDDNLNEYLPVHGGRRPKHDDEVYNLIKDMIIDIKTISDIDIPSLLTGIAALTKGAANSQSLANEINRLRDELSHEHHLRERYQLMLYKLSRSIRDYILTKNIECLSGLEEYLRESETSFYNIDQ